MRKIGLGFLALALGVGLYQIQNKHSATVPVTEVQALVNPPKASQKSTSSAMTSEKFQSLVQGKVSSGKSTVVDMKVLQLAQATLDQSQSFEVRRKALYVLTQMGAVALPALSEVATSFVSVANSQDPHSVAQVKQTFESSLRVTAMESLDELAKDESHSAAVKESMLRVLQVQKHRSLTLIAQISLSGIESGRPGKVKRAIDILLKEKG